MDGNLVKGWRNRTTTSTINEVSPCHVYVMHVLTPIASCNVVISEAFHDYVIVNRAFYDLITRNEGEELSHAVDASLGTILFHMTRKFGVSTYRGQFFIAS